ncbi:hypothetical protein SDC9_208363 [bioreactor metagenome]|uniref:DUF4402 domain-containing protein n=1 Tax=bioreactor metagenome TaxID=1076179 RepID=A0A645JJX9_9ZZZZ
MKIFTIAILTTLAFLMSAIVSLSAQSTVVGHVSAEIVEAISVSSNTIIDHTVNSHSLSYKANLSLGNMSIKSGSYVSCNIVIKPATASSENGESFKISPTTESQYISKAFTTNGNRTLALRGDVDLSDNPAAGAYKGSYSVIFAYN